MIASGLLPLLLLIVATAAFGTTVGPIGFRLQTGNAIFPLFLGLGLVGFYLLRRTSSALPRRLRVLFWGASAAGLLLSLPVSLPWLGAVIGVAVAGPQGGVVALRLAAVLGFTSLQPGFFVILQAAGILSLGFAWRVPKSRILGPEFLPFVVLIVLAALSLAIPFAAGPVQFDPQAILLGLITWTFLASLACLITGLWSLSTISTTPSS